MFRATFLAATFIATAAHASEVTFQFKNPSFSGENWSNHVLTIESLEHSRKKALEAEAKAAKEKAEAEAKNTNLNKFLNNLESRIYAQLSMQLANAMFADGATTGTLDFQGTTITWTKDTVKGEINLIIIDNKGNRTDITVPIGDFKF
jgi:hypothetical protein